MDLERDPCIGAWTETPLTGVDRYTPLKVSSMQLKRAILLEQYQSLLCQHRCLTAILCLHLHQVQLVQTWANFMSSYLGTRRLHCPVRLGVYH